LRIAGLYSGFAPGAPTPVPDSGFSQKDFAYRASIPAYASAIVVHGPSLLGGSSRAALNTRDAVYYERTSLTTGGQLETRTYFHRTRRNLIVVEVEVDCTACTERTQVSLRALSHSQVSDVVFQQRNVGEAADSPSPRQLIGVLRTPENCEPSVSHLYDSNHTLGYVHDICPESLTAAPGERATVQLLSALTLSSEHLSTSKESVVLRAMKVYEDAKRTPATQLLNEHRRGWSALWDAGGIELSTTDLALQQTTNSTLYYLLMSTRSDWLHSTLVPSTIAAAAPYPHGYDGHVFWDQDTFQAPPLMVFYPDVARNLLRNRLFQLPAYRINAQAFGLKGAYVPWEVGFSGGFARDDLVNHEEVHVAGDVALFIKQYYQLTRNSTELREFFPLLEGIADFVLSRVNRTDGNGWLSIENIVAPDESTGEFIPPITSRFLLLRETMGVGCFSITQI
jgi:trehalose/maltose hydrolase-like predicted phosphorylase